MIDEADENIFEQNQCCIMPNGGALLQEMPHLSREVSQAGPGRSAEPPVPDPSDSPDLVFTNQLHSSRAMLSR